jgi:hypothetical protein
VERIFGINRYDGPRRKQLSIKCVICQLSHGLLATCFGYMDNNISKAPLGWASSESILPLAPKMEPSPVLNGFGEVASTEDAKKVRLSHT